MNKNNTKKEKKMLDVINSHIPDMLKDARKLLNKTSKWRRVAKITNVVADDAVSTELLAPKDVVHIRALNER